MVQVCEDSVGSWFRMAASLQSRQKFSWHSPSSSMLGRAYGTNPRESPLLGKRQVLLCVRAPGVCPNRFAPRSRHGLQRGAFTPITLLPVQVEGGCSWWRRLWTLLCSGQSFEQLFHGLWMTAVADIEDLAHSDRRLELLGWISLFSVLPCITWGNPFLNMPCGCWQSLFSAF